MNFGRFMMLACLLLCASCSRKPEIERLHTHAMQFEKITHFMNAQGYTSITEIPFGYEQMTNLSLNREYKVFKKDAKDGTTTLLQVIVTQSGRLDLAGSGKREEIDTLKQGLEAVLAASRSETHPTN